MAFSLLFDFINSNASLPVGTFKLKSGWVFPLLFVCGMGICKLYFVTLNLILFACDPRFCGCFDVHSCLQHLHSSPYFTGRSTLDMGSGAGTQVTALLSEMYDRELCVHNPLVHTETHCA